jgi:hypothetical protein
MFQMKFTTFWLDTINTCKNQSEMRKRVDSLLQPPHQSATTELSADDFADFFRSKVQKFRSATATVPPQ